MGVLCFSALYSSRPFNAVGNFLILMGFFQLSVWIGLVYDFDVVCDIDICN